MKERKNMPLKPMISWYNTSMNTTIPKQQVQEESWALDLTPSLHAMQSYMYVQCAGFFRAKQNYLMKRTEPLTSSLLIRTLRGHGRISVGRDTLEAHPGSLILIDCRQSHSYGAEKPAGPRETGSCISGIPAGDAGSGSGQKIKTGFLPDNSGPEAREDAEDSCWDFQWLHFSGSCVPGYMEELSTAPLISYEDEGSLALFDSLFAASGNYSPSAELEISNQILLLCIHLAEIKKESIVSEETKLSPMVREALSLMEEAYKGPLSLDDICRRLSISKYYFSRQFTQQVGCSPYEYLLSLRLTAAKTLLRGTSLSVTEISSRSGFHNVSYFVSAFRKREGITPLTYRQTHAGM